MSALEGIRVVDLTQVVAGPFATMQLGDMGADIIKVEPPGTGEVTRRMGPTMTGDDSAAFLAMNRNKRSVTIDLKSDPGRHAFLALVDTADVLVENFRPGVTTRLGIDWQHLHDRNPRLIYASISGFGQTGPLANRAGYDLIAQGMSGVMSVTGDPDGDPVKCGIPISDLAAGLYCAFAVVTAWIARERTGTGQYIDISLFESALSMSIWETAQLWATGHVPGPLGSSHRVTAPYQALRTSDGWITVGANNHRLWLTFCEVIGRTDLVTDERFRDNDLRMANRLELAHEAESALAAATTAQWVERFEEAGFPAGPINDYQQVFEEPHTIEREMLQEYQHPVEGTVTTLGIPVKLSDTPGSILRPAPLLGEHTDEVLEEVIGADRVAAMRDDGVI